MHRDVLLHSEKKKEGAAAIIKRLFPAGMFLVGTAVTGFYLRVRQKKRVKKFFQKVKNAIIHAPFFIITSLLLCEMRAEWTDVRMLTDKKESKALSGRYRSPTETVVR